MDAAHSTGRRRFTWKRLTPVWPWLVAMNAIAVVAAVVGRFTLGPVFGPLSTFGIYPVALAAGAIWLRVHGKSGLRSAWGRAGTIEVGADGVAIIGRRDARFVSYGTLTKVRAQGPDRVRLWMSDGDEVAIGCVSSEVLEEAILTQLHAYAEAQGHAKLRVAVEEIAEPVLRAELKQMEGAR